MKDVYKKFKSLITKTPIRFTVVIGILLVSFLAVNQLIHNNDNDFQNTKWNVYYRIQREDGMPIDMINTPKAYLHDVDSSLIETANAYAINNQTLEVSFSITCTGIEYNSYTTSIGDPLAISFIHDMPFYERTYWSGTYMDNWQAPQYIAKIITTQTGDMIYNITYIIWIGMV